MLIAVFLFIYPTNLFTANIPIKPHQLSKNQNVSAIIHPLILLYQLTPKPRQSHSFMTDKTDEQEEHKITY
jgi:hypothetical protein